MRLLLSIITTIALLLVSTLAIAQDAPPVQVPFDATAIAQLIGSAGFAAATTALLRRAWPAIDGLYVWLVAGVLAVGSAVLARHAAQVPPIVSEIAGPIVALIGTVGAVQLAQSIAAKGGTSKTITVTDSTIIPPAPTTPTITER
jgi:hypothetical protein